MAAGPAGGLCEAESQDEESSPRGAWDAEGEDSPGPARLPPQAHVQGSTSQQRHRGTGPSARGLWGQLGPNWNRAEWPGVSCIAVGLREGRVSEHPVPLGDTWHRNNRSWGAAQRGDAGTNSRMARGHKQGTGGLLWSRYTPGLPHASRGSCWGPASAPASQQSAQGQPGLAWTLGSRERMVSHPAGEAQWCQSRGAGPGRALEGWRGQLMGRQAARAARGASRRLSGGRRPPGGTSGGKPGRVSRFQKAEEEAGQEGTGQGTNKPGPHVASPSWVSPGPPDWPCGLSVGCCGRPWPFPGPCAAGAGRWVDVNPQGKGWVLPGTAREQEGGSPSASSDPAALGPPRAPWKAQGVLLACRSWTDCWTAQPQPPVCSPPPGGRSPDRQRDLGRLRKLRWQQRQWHSHTARNNGKPKLERHTHKRIRKQEVLRVDLTKDRAACELRSPSTDSAGTWREGTACDAL